jgi:hypothetical protein
MTDPQQKPAPRFAEGTEVTAERSRAELETLLRKHGATEFGIYTSAERTVFQCRLKTVMLRQQVEYPKRGEVKYGRVGRGLTPQQALERALEAEWRRRWRALVLVVKAKLEIVASGGSTIEREFMADLLLANGQTMGQAMLPKVVEMYASGEMPEFGRLMLGPGAP